MIKLNKQVANLEDIVCKLQRKIDELEDKKQGIIDNATDNGYAFTSAVEKRLAAIDEKIDELNEEADMIQNAIDYLSNYTD